MPLPSCLIDSSCSLWLNNQTFKRVTLLPFPFILLGPIRYTIGFFFILTGWIQKRLIKMYVDCCKELSEVPKIKLLKKLYNLEVTNFSIATSQWHICLLLSRCWTEFWYFFTADFSFLWTDFWWWNCCVWLWPARFVYNTIDRCTAFPNGIFNAWRLSQLLRYIFSDLWSFCCRLCCIICLQIV